MSSSALYALPSFLGVALSLALAGLVLARFKRMSVHWAFSAAMVTVALVQVGNGLSLLAESPQEVLWWRRVALAGEILMPGGLLVFSLTFARSNVSEVIRDWRGTLVAVGGLIALFLAMGGSDRFFYLVPAQETATFSIVLGPTGVLFTCLYLIAQVLILANLEQTIRHADETTRWYLKFPVLGVGLLCLYLIYQSADVLLYRNWTPGLAWISGSVSVVTCLLIGYGFMHRPLPDVQIYVSRRVLSDSLTFLIVGVGLVLTGLVAQMIRYSGVAGQLSLSTLFVLLAVLGLALALSSHNVRLGIGRFVERNFFPHKYDYRARWMEVTEAIGAPGSQEQIGGRVCHILRGIWGPRTITIWVATDLERDTWMRIAQHKVGDTLDRLEGNGEVKAWLEAQSGPRVLAEPLHVAKDIKMLPLLEHLMESVEAVVVLPLKAGPQTTGWITLGPIPGERPYDQQDLDLLRSIAAQVANRLQHLMLSDKLSMAREMEAFYEYSTFFLHDLKNFTATLSLVTQNAAHRGGDPEFQRSAMNTVRATVGKMTALIGTLTALSRDPHPKLVTLDLNALVDDVLKGFESAGTKLSRERQSLPLVDADPDQLQQVVLNLVLNAQEAVGPEGCITVHTGTDGELVVLAVEDNGCGMDRVTVAGLFRPFHTLKGRGLGIGLYQCRKIVEAHKGTLTVESEPGKGSRFTVRLPQYREEKQTERMTAHG